MNDEQLDRLERAIEALRHRDFAVGMVAGLIVGVVFGIILGSP